MQMDEDDGDYLFHYPQIQGGVTSQFGSTARRAVSVDVMHTKTTKLLNQVRRFGLQILTSLHRDWE